MSKEIRLWVGVSGVTGYEIYVATTLRGLCLKTGVSYGTAKSKRAMGGFMVVSGSMVDIRSWWFQEVGLLKVVGRGSKKGTKIGK